MSLTVNVKLENERVVSARTEEWLVAILKVLTPEQQAEVYRLVDTRVVAKQIPGRHILQAEGLVLGPKGSPLGG